MVIGVLPGHKGRIDHHDHTHFIGQTPGLVQRATNPADGRSLLVGLTPDGLARLRDAQVTHHATARELLLARLDEHELAQLSELWEKAMPGSISSPVWPP